MNCYSSKSFSVLENFRLMPGVQRIILLDEQDKTFRTRIGVFGLSLLLAFIVGGLLVNVPLIYLLLGMGGLVFAYLLLFKIEVAVMLALLARDYLERYDYFGGGTAFHPNGLMGAAIIGGTMFFFLFNKIDFSRLTVFKHYLGFLVVCFISLMFAGDHFSDGLTVTLRLATALAMYAVLLYRLDSIRKVKWVIAIMIGAQIWPTIDGLLVIARGEGEQYRGMATARLGGGSSGVGAYLALILTLCVVHFLNAKTNSKRLLWGGLTGLFGVGLLFSYGRAGWIAFLVALVVIGLMKHMKMLTILPALLVLAIVMIPAVSQRFSDVDSTSLDDRNASTLGVRIELWKAAMQVYKTRPLFGVGYGVGRYRVGEYLAQYAWVIHNDYVMVLLSTGLVGLIMFMFWHAQWLVALLRVYQGAQHEYDKMIALGVFAVFIGSLVVRVTDNVLESTYKIYPLSALIATTLALPRIRVEEEAQKSDMVVSKGYPCD